MTNNDFFVIICRPFSIFARLDDRWVVVQDSLSECRMDQLLTPTLPLIPYAQASPAQLAQAVLTAKEALGPHYSDLPWSQWYEAFAYFQPLLLVEPNQVSITAEGLTAIAQFFDTRYPVSVPISPLLPTPAAPPPGLESASGPSLPPAPPTQIKRTYSLRLDVLESLERVSFWRREVRSDLVNLALEQLMATYPESQIPLPKSRSNFIFSAPPS